MAPEVKTLSTVPKRPGFMSEAQADTFLNKTRRFPDDAERIFGAEQLKAFNDLLNDPYIKELDGHLLTGGVERDEADGFLLLEKGYQDIRAQLIQLATKICTSPSWRQRIESVAGEFVRSGKPDQIAGMIKKICDIVNSQREPKYYLIRNKLIEIFWREMIEEVCIAAGRIVQTRNISRKSHFIRALQEIGKQNDYWGAVAFDQVSKRTSIVSEHRPELTRFIQHYLTIEAYPDELADDSDALHEGSMKNPFPCFEHREEGVQLIFNPNVGKEAALNGRGLFTICHVIIAFGEPLSEEEMSTPPQNSSTLLFRLDRATGELVLWWTQQTARRIMRPEEYEALKRKVHKILVCKLWEEEYREGAQPEVTVAVEEPTVEGGQDEAHAEVAAIVSDEAGIAITLSAAMVAPPKRRKRRKSEIRAANATWDNFTDVTGQKLLAALCRTIGDPIESEGDMHFFRGADGRRRSVRLDERRKYDKKFVSFHIGEKLGVDAPSLYKNL